MLLKVDGYLMTEDEYLTEGRWLLDEGRCFLIEE